MQLMHTRKPIKPRQSNTLNKVNKPNTFIHTTRIMYLVHLTHPTLPNLVTPNTHAKPNTSNTPTYSTLIAKGQPSSTRNAFGNHSTLNEANTRNETDNYLKQGSV